jgi:hypothetical protein
MTPQEIFDTVARHLFTQGKRAGILRDGDDGFYGPVFRCRYRTPDGATCAVGRLLPDDAYDPKMEGTSVLRLIDNFGGTLPSWMRENADLLDRLQKVHDQEDHWASDKRMRWELSLVAQSFGLDDSILPGLSFNRPEGQNA